MTAATAKGYVHRFTPGAAGAVVLLHGTGGDAAGFDAFGATIAPGAARLSLQGDVDENGMARFFRRLGEGRYDMADLGMRTEKLAGFLEAALPRHGMSKATGIGYSNGANILANLALTGRGPLRRLALMHPLIPFQPSPPPLEEWSVLITAGRRDPICPPGRTQALAGALTAAGASVDLAWFDAGHEATPAEAARVAAFVAA